LLLVSHVLPVPSESGQRQRVKNTLLALRDRFRVTFLTSAEASSAPKLALSLREYCDDVIILPRASKRGWLRRSLHVAHGVAYCVATGERWSNYAIGRLDFTPSRINAAIVGREFDVALFEYWHAHRCAVALRQSGLPTVLDMHNLLWQSHMEQVSRLRWLPQWLRDYAVQRYRKREEASWNDFDALIAINREEFAYTAARLKTVSKMFYVPMGVQLDEWPYRWSPAAPPRIAFYGGLGSPHNQIAALRCARRIMPLIWRHHPASELWIIGSTPPPEIVRLGSDRIKVTGFVKDVGSILATATCVMCPWQGTYGFRSRLIEAMATGVPVVATPDAVHGMELAGSKGLLVGDGDDDLSKHVRRLIENHMYAKSQSELARAQVESAYGFPATYGKFAAALERWICDPSRVE
jgi:glycosyltransferase involved in cell wall biosynthesis